MSSYNLSALNPNHAVVAGWDPPLHNYFYWVIDESVPEDHPKRTVDAKGSDGLGTEQNVDQILTALSKWATIPEGFRSVLLEDRECEGSRPPTPLMKAWFNI